MIVGGPEGECRLSDAKLVKRTLPSRRYSAASDPLAEV